MQRKGITNLPLHTDHTPPWLWKRMVKLSGALTEVILEEYSLRASKQKRCLSNIPSSPHVNKCSKKKKKKEVNRL